MSTKQLQKERQAQALHRMVTNTIFYEADNIARLMMAALDHQGTETEDGLLNSVERHTQSIIDDLETLFPDSEDIHMAYMEMLDRQTFARMDFFWGVKYAKPI